MNWVHIHLLLNHVPVIGIVLAVPILAWGIGRRSEEVIRLSLVLLAALAAVTIVVYLTGEPAEEAVEGLSGVSESLIERHEEAALLATAAFAAIGALALAGLIRFRRGPIPRRFAAVVLGLALVPAAMVGWTANLGGEIRHTEIGPGAPAELDPVASAAVRD